MISARAVTTRHELIMSLVAGLSLIKARCEAKRSAPELNQTENETWKTMSRTKATDDSQLTANFIRAFVYTALNVCFDRNRELAFTGKSQKQPFCP